MAPAVRVGRAPVVRLPGFPVLLYHGLVRSPADAVPAGERRYWVPAEQFREHLDALAPAEVGLLAECWARPPIPGPARRPVVLTFDDGNASDYRLAFPALAARGLRAEFFVNTALIGRPGFLRWSEIVEMQRAGMSFQSHGDDHVDLLALSGPALRRQLEDSRRRLEDRLGRAVHFLAAPYGRVDGRIVAAAIEAGYRAVCGSRAWPARPGARLVHRVAVYRHTTPRGLRHLLDRRPLPYLRRLLRAAVAFGPKRVLRHWRPARLGARVWEEPA